MSWPICLTEISPEDHMSFSNVDKDLIWNKEKKLIDFNFLPPTHLIPKIKKTKISRLFFFR